MEKTANFLTNEWTEIIDRDYHHSCILIWTPINEGWGTGFNIEGKGWGHTSVNDVQELIADYKRVIDTIYQSKAFVGFCYTQITDVG